MTDERHDTANDDANNDATPIDGDDGRPGADMTDARFDSWLHAASSDYNRPGDSTPRDAMWSAIERSLPATLVPIRPARRTNVWWQAAAALLLLAGGIAIGRQWSSAPNATMAQQDAPATSPAAEGDLPAVQSVPSGSQLAAAESATGTDAPTSPASGNSAQGATARASASGNESYDVAALEHLSRAEALLTSFRTPRSAGDGTPLNRWARDLLADTRLLLDSPAATDARRRALLEDLELVLAQIVQLPAEASADRGLVQRSIERGAVLSRLRSSIPAGYASGT